MKVRAIVTRSAIGFLISGQLMLAGQSEPTRDDALVLAAVIEHTILPAVRNASSRVSRTPVAIVNGQSIALCKERSTNQTKCAIPESWRMFLVPDAARNWPGLVPDDASCGSLCGYDWLFVLEKSDGQWRVKSAMVTSIA